jgi:hypothetical protein
MIKKWHLKALVVLVATMLLASQSVGVSYPEALANFSVAANDYAARAYQKYPEQTRFVYERFAGTDPLLTIEEQCHERAIPVIYDYAKNGSAAIYASNLARNAVNGLIGNEQFTLPELTEEDYALAMLGALSKRCDAILHQHHVAPDGTVERLTGQQVVDWTIDFGIGSMLAVERKLAADEAIEAGDIVGVALELFAGYAVFKAVKLAKAGKGVYAADVGIRAHTVVPLSKGQILKSALVGVGNAAFAKRTWVLAGTGFALVAVTQPHIALSVVSAFVDTAALVLGWMPLPLQLVLWVVVAVLLYGVLTVLLKVVWRLRFAYLLSVRAARKINRHLIRS